MIIKSKIVFINTYLLGEYLHKTRVISFAPKFLIKMLNIHYIAFIGTNFIFFKFSILLPIHCFSCNLKNITKRKVFKHFKITFFLNITLSIDTINC